VEVGLGFGVGVSAAWTRPTDPAKIAKTAPKMQISFNVVLSLENVVAARMQIVANTWTYRFRR
jgi:hypothetical protein